MVFQRHNQFRRAPELLMHRRVNRLVKRGLMTATS